MGQFFLNGSKTGRVGSKTGLDRVRVSGRVGRVLPSKNWSRSGLLGQNWSLTRFAWVDLVAGWFCSGKASRDRVCSSKVGRSRVLPGRCRGVRGVRGSCRGCPSNADRCRAGRCVPIPNKLQITNQPNKTKIDRTIIEQTRFRSSIDRTNKDFDEQRSDQPLFIRYRPDKVKIAEQSQN